MKINVLVKTQAKKESVSIDQNGIYIVRVRVVPEDGKANQRLVELLAEHFGVAKSSVQLLTGQKSKKKIFNIG